MNQKPLEDMWATYQESMQIPIEHLSTAKKAFYAGARVIVSFLCDGLEVATEELEEFEKTL